MMKKERTTKQQANFYRNVKYGCIGGEFLSAITPFVVIAIVNKDKYFVEYDGTRMSIALFMALALMGFAIWGISSKKIKDTLIGFMLKWAIVAFIFTMLGQIITDIATIMWFGLIGLAVAQGFEIGSKKASEKQKFILEARKEANKQNLVEQAKEETKVKVRIKDND